MTYVIMFFLLFLNWIIWSGKFDAFHLILGVFSCLLITYTSHNLLFKRDKFLGRHVTEVVRFLKYIPWLLYQIFLSNLHVAYLVLHPRMPIQPSLITFRTKLKKSFSLLTFGNSITLTPGTITAEIRGGEYYIVHSLSRKVADDLLSGDMENRVAHIFEED